MMTPDYASPEQIQGKELTTATDIYSLGVLLYELLAGFASLHASQSSPAAAERVVCEQNAAQTKLDCRSFQANSKGAVRRPGQDCSDRDGP